MPTLLVVTTSTRPVRIGPVITDWFASFAREHGGFDVDVADLGELNLPMMDEPQHPRLGQYEREHTKRWSAQVKAADAIVFVTPEYNGTFTAALKNAIDYLSAEWAYKPVSFVSYGGLSGGLRAVLSFKPIASAMGMYAIPQSVALPMPWAMIQDSVLHPNDIALEAATTTLDELLKIGTALAPLRQQ